MFHLQGRDGFARWSSTSQHVAWPQTVLEVS